MEVATFRNRLLECVSEFQTTISTAQGDWVVKGFIDVCRNIYTISVDTKVVSKIIELMLFPIISRFARNNGLKMVLSEHQNHYPDISFVAPDGTRIALDLKSTYRIDGTRVNGFTLGAFTGYFRQRDSHKNVTFPYQDYQAHVVLGVVYSRQDDLIDERRIYSLEELNSIVSVVKDFVFLVQEKWRIAGERPGSGNTKNIGSIQDMGALLSGNGPFAAHGAEIFDDYWMNYLTEDMARAIDSTVPYRNLSGYLQWRKRSAGMG